MGEGWARKTYDVYTAMDLSKQDAARRSNPWDSAGQKLHLRSVDVKRVVHAGVYSTQHELHAKLSWAAWNARVGQAPFCPRLIVGGDRSGNELTS